MTYSIFIPGNVPSSKNNRVWTGKFYVASKATQLYKKSIKNFMQEHKQEWLEALNHLSKPYKVYFKFYRKTNHAFDYINPLQTIQDEMVHYGWLEDDNADVLLPILEPYEDRRSGLGAGVEIKIIF